MRFQDTVRTAANAMVALTLVPVPIVVVAFFFDSHVGYRSTHLLVGGVANSTIERVARKNSPIFIKLTATATISSCFLMVAIVIICWLAVKKLQLAVKVRTCTTVARRLSTKRSCS